MDDNVAIPVNKIPPLKQFSTSGCYMFCVEVTHHCLTLARVENIALIIKSLHKILSPIQNSLSLTQTHYRLLLSFLSDGSLGAGECLECVQLKSYQIEPLYYCILFDYYFCNGRLVSSVECIVYLFVGQIRDVWPRSLSETRTHSVKVYRSISIHNAAL